VTTTAWLIALSPFLVTARAVAQPPPIATPGQVVSLPDPGVELTAPSDGRLRGLGVAMVVTGAALVDRAGQGDSLLRAGARQHLLVFSLRRVSLPGSQVVQGVEPALAVVEGSQRMALDITTVSQTHPSAFAVPVAASRTEAFLELTSGGVSQRFDLMTLSRTGPDPVALYRDADTPDVLAQPSGQATVSAAVPTDGFAASLAVNLTQLRLSWYSPGPSGGTAPDANHAFLSVEARYNSTIDNAGHFIGAFTAAVPADHVHLVLPEGTTITAQHTGDTSDLLSGTYYFLVPANLSTATLSVDPVQTSAGENVVVLVNGPVTVNLAAFTIPLSLPTMPPPAPTTPTTLLHLSGADGNAPPSQRATGPTGHGNGSWAALIAAVILTALVLAVALVLIRRRRPALETGTANPVEPPPVPPSSKGPEGPATSSPPTTVAETVETAGPSVLVLGPVNFDGLDVSRLRAGEIELLLWLVVHADEAVDNDRIRSAMTPGRKGEELSSDTVRTYLSRLRRLLGTDRLSEAINGRYRLSGVDCDLARFQQALAVSASAQPGDIATSLADALRLVRGVPFTGTDYRWTAPMIARTENQIIEAADRLATWGLQTHDAATAAWAAERGLAGCGHPDERLLAHLLRAAASNGPATLAGAWREVTARLTVVEDAPSSSLIELYGQLREERGKSHPPP
jgi:hypothetical protein